MLVELVFFLVCHKTHNSLTSRGVWLSFLALRAALTHSLQSKFSSANFEKSMLACGQVSLSFQNSSFGLESGLTASEQLFAESLQRRYCKDNRAKRDVLAYLMRAGLLQIKDIEVTMRLSRVFLSRALLLCIAAFSAFSLYLVALPFMMLTGEHDAPHLAHPAVANTGDGYWRSILGLGSLLNTVDQQLSESAEELRSIQRSMTHLSTNYALHGAWAPLSPAEYVFPLHSSAVLLHILPYPHLLKCSDIEELSDSGPAGVTHSVAQICKLSSPTQDYISQSTSVGHPFALFCQSQNGNVDSGSEECYQGLNHKLMVEGIFRQELEHYMIIKVCVYVCVCVRVCACVCVRVCACVYVCVL